MKKLIVFTVFFVFLFSSTELLGQDGPWPGLNIGTLSCPSNTVQSGNTTGAGNNCSNNASGDHFYQFTTTVTADVTLDVCGASWDTRLYLYDVSESCGGTYLYYNDDGCGLQSTITANSLPAGTYVVVVEGYTTNEGAYDLTIDLSGCPTNMSYVSSTVTQNNTSDVGAGTTNQEIICIQVVTTGNLSPLTANGFRLRTNGTTNTATDISNAKIWYTGTSNTFATTTQFGSTYATPPAPGANMDIAGSQTLAEGTNYFWVTYDIQGGATPGNFVDARCNIIQLSSGGVSPTPQAPAGNRQIPLPCTVDQVIGSLPYSQAGMTTNGFGDDFDSGDACGSSYMNGDDFVFTYTPAADECINIELTNTDTWVGIFVTDGCPDAGANCVDFATTTGSNPSLSGVNLTNGTTYYFTVSTFPSPQFTAFDILVEECPAPPPNDDCANAIALTVNPDYACGTVTPGTVEGATQSADAEGCFGNSDDDVWYSFVATGTAHRVEIQNIAGSTTDMYHSVYSGACGSLTELLCSDPNTSDLTGLTPGNTYYVRVYTYTSTGGQTSTFDVCVGTAPPPPANDDCVNAEALTVNADQACGVVTSGTVTSATQSVDAEGCTGSSDDDVWYSFVATNPTHEIDLLNIAGSTTDMYFSVYSGTCGSLTELLCSDPNSAEISGLSVGNTYYVRVYTYTSTAGQTSTFDICIGTPPPPPMNDEPCNAIILPVGSGACSYTGAYNNHATASEALQPGIAAPGCSSYSGGDVWFEITVPASGRLIVDLDDSGGPTDMGMAWYTSSTSDCNNLDGLVECDDDDSQNGAMPMICRAGVICTVPGDCDQNATLTPGQTIWVRVFEYGNNNFGPFDICAYEPAAPGAASNCSNTEVIPSIPFGSTGETTCCRNNDYDATVGCLSSYQDGEDYVYEYTPASDIIVDITVTGTSSYTGVFVTDRCPDHPAANCVGNDVSTSGNPTLCAVSLTAGTTYYIMVDTDPGPACTPFNISILESTAPACGMNYTASTTTFNFESFFGTNIVLPIDDRFCDAYIPIGFDFCYDGISYSQVLVSSNGYVIFDPIGCATNLPSTNASPNSSSGWSISAAIPNTTNAPRNAILTPWHDINPAIGGVISYATLGTAPNRRFIITYIDAPLYSCTSLLNSHQVKLYESSYNIEIHMRDKGLCTGWNSGASIMGIHNYNGTSAVCPAGYNYPDQWSATNEAWRFTCNCVGCVTPLPVDLLYFDFDCEPKTTLVWATTSEENNDYFIVEESIDGLEFEEIGIVSGAGNSNETNFYKFSEDVKGNRYYRLKQVDFNGKITEKNIIYANCSNPNSIVVGPNPIQEGEILYVTGLFETITVIDMLGRTVDVEIVENEIRGLQSGVYIIKVDDYITKAVVN